MHVRSVVRFTAITTLLVFCFAFVSALPTQFSYAQGDTAADAQCTPVIPTCPCKTVPNPNPQGPKCIPGANQFMCPCMQTDNGFPTSGFCDATQKCKATATGGKSPDQGLSQLMQALGQLLSKLGQPSPPSSSPTSPTTGATGCTSSYYETSNTALIGVDPCALYQASASGSTCTDPSATNFGQSTACSYNTNGTPGGSTCSLLNQIAGTCGGSGTPTPGVNGDTLLATPTSGATPLAVTFSTIPASSDASPFTIDFGDGSNNAPMTQGACSQSTLGGAASSCQYSATHTYTTPGTFTANLLDANGLTLASATISVQNPGGGTPNGLSQVLNNVGNFLLNSSTTSQGPLQGSSNFPGVFGNILLNNGASIYATTINSSNNTETSGFYGSASFNGQPQGAAAQLCVTRPWASNFLAAVIPPSFFDSLCQWGGYQVGEPPPPQAPQVTLQQKPPASAPAATTTPAAPTVQPQAQIWAVPAAVPLGARTSVFWNSQGVTSCTETSPDGSFSENTLAGAASTVPLTGSTTYTISCLDPNGNPVTNYTTVNISS